MALAAPPVSDRRRVKVYELKNNDWFDRGTGFCTATVANDESRIHVKSEEDPERMLLETKITRDDGYQKQQDTLIVWTDQNVTDMALSFQEAEGCTAIWEFVIESQQRLGVGAAGMPRDMTAPSMGLIGLDDGLSDDLMDHGQEFILPEPVLANVADIENTMRMANNTAPGREALARFIVSTDYLSKLVPLVQDAEDLESLSDLHRLCGIMKTIILLNENTIIEQVVRDEFINGVLGALEYDPEFPTFKANHRKYLDDPTRFKEVVKITDPAVRQKIHYTYRLQYLKDVVLARILDDPTFSVLNSLIFFNQVEIVQHVQANPAFLEELFGIFTTPDVNPPRKKDAVLFIQQCCQIAKGLQVNARAGLFSNFINGGLFHVITYALKHPDAQIRVSGTDILINLIDHDSFLMRTQLFKAVHEKQKPLTDTLIELLLVEPDLGVKSQMAEAIKVLLDPIANSQSVDAMTRANGDYMARMRSSNMVSQGADHFVQQFYDDSVKKLFKPLKDLDGRQDMSTLTFSETQLLAHLVEVLCFFVRTHSFRTKYFLISEGLALRIAQLFKCPEKHLQLMALKYFRTCLGLHDPFHYKIMAQHHLLEPILDILVQTMPKDNLLNSACLDFFESIRRESAKELVQHLVETAREKMEKLSYMETFRLLLEKYDQIMAPVPDELSFTTVETDTPTRTLPTNGQRWQGLKDDHEEEAYFNTSDNEEDGALSPPLTRPLPNGQSPSPFKPLVDYPEDDDEFAHEGEPPTVPNGTAPVAAPAPAAALEERPKDAASARQETPPPPERVVAKRRRDDDDDDDDELGKLSSQPKRRTSVGSVGSVGSNASAVTNVSTGPTLRRKRSLSSNKDGAAKKITISLAVKAESAKVDGQ